MGPQQRYPEQSLRMVRTKDYFEEVGNGVLSCWQLKFQSESQKYFYILFMGEYVL